MKKLALTAVLAGSLALTGCATHPYGQDPYYGSQYGYQQHHGQTDQAGRAAAGAVIGGAAGAIGGAIIPGVSPVTGAVAGAILGGVAGAVINNRQYYRDTRGYCYYVDQYGRPHYDYNVRC
jgi:ABC-type antimicrobial peptide transport system permease subunit